MEVYWVGFGVLEVTLKVWLANLRVWFQGRKTILGGCLLIAAGVAGVWAGKLPPDQAMIVVGFGISFCGWSAKANRHQQEILAALRAVAIAGAEARAGNKAAAIRTVEESVMQPVPALSQYQGGQL